MTKLPRPRREGTLSVEAALAQRRSVRNLKEGSLQLAELSQLLWAAQGVTGSKGARTAPSAGALYPLELWVVAAEVEGLAPGAHRYDPSRHALQKVSGGDRRPELAAAALGQPWIAAGAAVLVLTAVYERMAQRYSDRGTRYTDMEAGHAAQNVYLQAEALGLGTVVVGAFEDDLVKRAIPLPPEEAPLYLIPVGRR